MWWGAGGGGGRGAQVITRVPTDFQLLTLLVNGAEHSGTETRADLGQRTLLLQGVHHQPAQLCHLAIG